MSAVVEEAGPASDVPRAGGPGYTWTPPGRSSAGQHRPRAPA